MLLYFDRAEKKGNCMQKGLKNTNMREIFRKFKINYCKLNNNFGIINKES